MKRLLRGGLNRWSEGRGVPARAGAGASGLRIRPGRTAEISRAGDERVGRDGPGGGEVGRVRAVRGAVTGAVTDGSLTDSRGLHAVIVTAGRPGSSGRGQAAGVRSPL